MRWKKELFIGLIVSILVLFYVYQSPTEINTTQTENIIHKKVQKTNIKKNNTNKYSYKSPYVFTLNKITSYYLDFNQTSIVPFGKQNKTIKNEIISLLHIRPVKIDSKYVYLFVQLSKIKLKIPMAQNVLDMIKKVYSSLFLVKMDKHGKILEISTPFDDTTSAGIKEMFYLLQSINKPYRYYETVEKDISGKYKASYTKKGLEIKKQKLKYVSYANKNRIINIIKSESNFTVDNSGDWIKKLRLIEKTSSKETKGRNVENENSILLKKTVADVKNLIIYKEKRAFKQIYNTYSGQKKNVNLWQKAQQQNTLARINQTNISINYVLDKLKQNPKDINNYRMLVEYLRAKPDSAKAIVSNFGTFDDAVKREVIAALSLANEKETEKALINIAENSSFGKVNQMRAIVGINLMKNPTTESLNTLDRLSSDTDKDVSNSAVLAYGTVTGKLKSTAGINELKQKYYSAYTSSKKRTLILAMQNAGPEYFLDELKKEALSKSIKNRKAAIAALAKIKDEDLRKQILKEELKIQTNPDLKNYIRVYLNLIKK